ncbi:hypothetical protein ACFSQ7_33645 [Paenibacillus rhizoplanae]
MYNTLNTIKYLAKLNDVPNIEEVSGSLIELMRGGTREFKRIPYAQGRAGLYELLCIYCEIQIYGADIGSGSSGR